ncbi:hydroxymethylglutaryl-CoA lyase [Serinicoccus sp. LYQ131]|uniref:hydroxymethylglutaryl-CoA lyase n=1 Tax=Serinicoccus sp. LYQ131 TaxID=3378797 RepID=UPI003853B716
MATATTAQARDYTGMSSVATFPFELPATVIVQEVGPRDGFQLERRRIPTDAKVAIIDALSASGLPAIQLTSFVRPEAVPQLSDADEVLRRIERNPAVDYSVLVPNLRGAERAAAFAVDTWELMLSTTDAHSIANANRPTSEAFDRIRPAIELGQDEGVRLVGVMATALGCPFEGRPTYDRIAWVVGLYAEAGVRCISIADTAGLADPAHVHHVLARLGRDFPDITFSVHLHNTRGLGMANVLASIAAGVTILDASVGGLGGCPYAPGASGNIATEELVHMLELLGIGTGVDLDALIRIARHEVAPVVDHSLESSFARADPSWQLHTVPDA